MRPAITWHYLFLRAEFRAGRATARSATWWHQRVQGARGSSVAGLQRAGRGEHLSSETSICASTEPGESNHTKPNTHFVTHLQLGGNGAMLLLIKNFFYTDKHVYYIFDLLEKLLWTQLSSYWQLYLYLWPSVPTPICIGGIRRSKAWAPASGGGLPVSAQPAGGSHAS